MSTVRLTLSCIVDDFLHLLGPNTSVFQHVSSCGDGDALFQAHSYCSRLQRGLIPAYTFSVSGADSPNAGPQLASLLSFCLFV